MFLKEAVSSNQLFAEISSDPDGSSMHGPSQMHFRDLQQRPSKEPGRLQLGGCGMGSRASLDIGLLLVLDIPDFVDGQFLENSILHPGMFSGLNVLSRDWV